MGKVEAINNDIKSSDQIALYAHIRGGLASFLDQHPMSHVEVIGALELVKLDMFYDQLEDME